jgi:hypothetical protein
MSDEMTFTLHNPLTEEEWDMITDVDLDHTTEITFHTKHGKEVVFVKRKLPSAQPETNCSEIPNSSDFVSRKAVREMVATWSYDMAEWEDVELALHDVDELPPVSAERQRGKKNK